MFELTTENLTLLPPVESDCIAYLRFITVNRHAFARSEPTRSNAYYTLNNCKTFISDSLKLASEDRGYRFFIRLKGEPEIIGSIAVSNVIRGAFQAAHLGYKLSESEWRQGLMKEALSAFIPAAFQNLKLHRIMANYEGWNIGSEKLLSSLGFEEEGMAKEYLFLDGQWRDHILTSLINEKF
ncbi:GNAT family N-acetyltransferase [Oligoflexaceae bacterium]|nr:GNAT family N-acetyltransferase [Oligoflexaceae bacterium]